MARADGIGLNVAHFRSVAGKSQQWLADRINDLRRSTGRESSATITRAYISMIENGHRVIAKRDLLDDLAVALGVSATDLTGQPYRPTTTADMQTWLVVPQIRAAIEEPEDDEPAPPRTIEELDLMVDRAMSARMNCSVPDLATHLPAAITDLRRLWFDRGDRAAGELLVKALVTASLAIKPAGWVDLGIRLADLADTVARAHGDPVCIAAAQFAVAQGALATTRRRTSARIAAAGADELDRLTRTKMPAKMLNDVMAWLGMLQLHAALAEAGQPGGDPQARLAVAASLARRVVGNPWRMEFSDANVGCWGVAVALEDGSPDLAPQLARRVDVNRLITPQRKARLHLDWGRAHVLTEEFDAAVLQLLEADRAAPGDLRNRPTAVEIVGHLVRGGAHPSDELHELAVRVGIYASATT